MIPITTSNSMRVNASRRACPVAEGVPRVHFRSRSMTCPPQPNLPERCVAAVISKVDSRGKYFLDPRHRGALGNCSFEICISTANE